MPYYHASRNVYPVRHVICVPAGATAHAYQLSLQLGNEWREDALEAARGGRAWTRKTAVYAADTPANAVAFLVSQHDPQNSPVRVYEVEIEHDSPSPMVLIGYLDAQGQKFPRVAECVEEYWRPTRDWEFLEYVCREMRVVADLVVIDHMDVLKAKCAYENDFNRVRQIWGVPPP